MPYEASAALPHGLAAGEESTDEVVAKRELTPRAADLRSISTPTQALRRSPRKRTAATMKEESDEEEIAQGMKTSRFWPSISSSRKRVGRTVTVKERDSDDETLPTLLDERALTSPNEMQDDTKGSKRKTRAKRGGSSSPAKVKREYAPPEVYAHLQFLSDHLQDHLDVMFCGINPGCKSAETGHHFAHPTNHFWRALHLAGFTDRQLKPSEDHTLPAAYNIGLTNLVARPSAEQAELSRADMQAGVPALLAKVARHAPRVLCFVGKQIGEVFLRQAAPPPPLAQGAARARRPAVAMGFQPYRAVHARGGAVRETLFFVAPSSSARVAGYQLKDKAALLRSLCAEVQRLKAGRGMDTAGMQVVPLPAGVPGA